MTDGSDGDDTRPHGDAATPESSADAGETSGAAEETDGGTDEGPSGAAAETDSAATDAGDPAETDDSRDVTGDETDGADESGETVTGDTDEGDGTDGADETAVDDDETDAGDGGGTGDAGDADGGSLKRVADDEWDGSDARGGPSVDDHTTVGGRRDYDRPGRDEAVDTDGSAASDDSAGTDDTAIEADTAAPAASDTDTTDDTAADADATGASDPEPGQAEADGGDAPLAEEALTDTRAGDGPVANPEHVPTETIDEADEGLFGEGPESDEEMPLTEHIEEMMRRLGYVFAVAGTVILAVLVIGNYVPAVPDAEAIITFLWDTHVDFDNYRPYVYGPLELLLTKLKVAGLAGLVVALPVFVYQTYRFMRPGLYPHERRYYLAAVPTSLVLALVGVAFAHFVVLPAIFQYFISYTEASASLAFGLRETFNLILLLMGYMAIVFQIPLFIQLAIMMGVVTREWLEQRRLLFWGSFLGLSFVVSPDPTGMSPIIVAATMVVLFEGTLALLRWTGN
ncbi:twin-arginine translocase subunit TatC [Halobaculum sp. MBLA0147]|uniref:twin-arginine translocase subunit TatC n=1 Tax=Halobaculum sp. MBLA0147 TaxID=3079934 RepID=UPI0035242A65